MTDAEGAGELLARVRSGDRRALARAISVVEDTLPGVGELLAGCRETAGRALRVGITGPPGAGKSTLVARLAPEFRGRGRRVAVLAIDPSSPITGGALLGDRVRLGTAEDEEIFFRSMALRGASGGIAAATGRACGVLEAAGYEVILIETVGTGQDEVEVASVADRTVVVLAPGWGDEVQSLKAGILEIADIVVINKCDCEGAARAEAALRSMQTRGKEGMERPLILRTVATAGEGVSVLVDQIWRLGPEVGRVGAGEDKPLLDHLGIAVRSIWAASGFYAALGLEMSQPETIEHERVRTAMLQVGASRLELLEPTQEDSTVGRFLARRGEGVHHIALRMTNIDAVFQRLRDRGIRLASDEIRIGAGGHSYFFIHPESTGGVLVEIVEEMSEGVIL